MVEIWPGGGWYTEILAPYLASGGGKLILASPEWGRGGITKFKAANATLYGPLTVADFPVFDGKAAEIAPGSADVVLTFRNVHNWRMGYKRDDKADYSLAAFQQIFAMLKPGGVLGIEDHRLPESAERRARARQRLYQDLDRRPPRRAGRVQARRLERDQRQSQGHGRLGEWRVDAAALASRSRTRTAPNMPRSAKATE